MLRGLIEAESVIPELTQDKLLALTRWIGSAPGFALTYPDLRSVLMRSIATTKTTSNLPQLNTLMPASSTQIARRGRR